ncbi:MAG: hypothetical protein OXC29_15450 [Rhodococcus sp.]|nr:hypothetical protein [Rhodococcus sp. (in: high G+C Gram-positive bacteria)]
MRRNGFGEARDPILKPLDTIECRDAILTPDSFEPEWPWADVVIGNPPFLGGKLLITHLGENYVSRMFKTYADRVPAEADLVCYWFEKAGQQVALGKAARVGLVATNSIRGHANRRALQAATAARRIFEAWSDEPWVVEGAAVPVSLVCFSRPTTNSCPAFNSTASPSMRFTRPDWAPRRCRASTSPRSGRLSGERGVGSWATRRAVVDVAGDQRGMAPAPRIETGATNADVLTWINGWT